MRRKRKQRQKERGFTLVELLVVMGILSVLAALVFPTVTGVRTSGETAAGQSDAKQTENALNTFASQSRTQEFPESPIPCTAATTTSPAILTINGKSVTAGRSTIGQTEGKIPSSLASALGMTLCGTGGGYLATHTQMKWDATTEVRQKDGTLVTLKFIPDFLTSKPNAAKWVRGSSLSAPDEFVWLLLKGTASDMQGRTLQVMRLNKDGDMYEIIKE